MDAFFDDSINKWTRNYWGKSRFFPKIIFGIMVLFEFDDFWIPIPWINIDWNPAKKPYII